MLGRSHKSSTSHTGESFDPTASLPGESRTSSHGLPEGTRRVLVLGASRSGASAAKVLARLGLEVLVADREAPERLPSLGEAIAAGAVFVAEELLETAWPEPDLVVKSPGIPGGAAPVVQARTRGVPVWGELELAYVLLPNPFDAITGTNGKTTTAALLGHLFAAAGRPMRVLGNIGVAVSSVVGEIGPEVELVTEVSSFQLEDICSFRPVAGVFLNLTPDHLDRHGSMERYLVCKANLFRNQTSEDTAVLNAVDPAGAALGVELTRRLQGPQVLFFSVNGRNSMFEPPGGGLCAIRDRLFSFVESGWVYAGGERLLKVTDIRLPGRHNLENCLAAATAAIVRGLTRDQVAEGLATFSGVRHRLETVGIVDGVRYVNDSKATNVEATLTALGAYPEKVHLILGGRDKASDYRPIARACGSSCKGVYLIGEAASLIEAAFREVKEQEGMAGVPPVRVCGVLERAVEAAAAAAEPGDVVLLAPACASFDQYRSFEERGDQFCMLVKSLAGERS